MGMEFTFEDGKNLCSLLSRQQAPVDKKRRWLGSMIRKADGRCRRVKRLKFLDDAYLLESYVRSEKISCEKVRAIISSSSECGYTHHLVLDGLRLFCFQERDNGPLTPEYLDIMQCTISKLSYGSLQSVACIVSQSKFNFDKTRQVMEKIVKSYLPGYLTNLDKNDITCQLFNIFRNPCSCRSGSVSLATPVSPQLLSAMNHALDGLDGMPMHALVAINRMLREKSFTPKFGLVAHSSKRGHLVEMVRKRCNKILTELKEGNISGKPISEA